MWYPTLSDLIIYAIVFVISALFRYLWLLQYYFTSITPPRLRKPCVGRNIEDSDADLYAEYHGGKMTPESTSSSEGSVIERTRILERRVDRKNISKEPRYCRLTPDLSNTINTNFASIHQQTDHGEGQSFDFHGWFEGIYEEHHRMTRETSAGSMTPVSPYDDELRARSWSQG